MPLSDSLRVVVFPYVCTPRGARGVEQLIALEGRGGGVVLHCSSWWEKTGQLNSTCGEREGGGGVNLKAQGLGKVTKTAPLPDGAMKVVAFGLLH
jgi:hypothetical protein